MVSDCITSEEQSPRRSKRLRKENITTTTSTSSPSKSQIRLPNSIDELRNIIQKVKKEIHGQAVTREVTLKVVHCAVKLKLEHKLKQLKVGKGIGSKTYGNIMKAYFGAPDETKESNRRLPQSF